MLKERYRKRKFKREKKIKGEIFLINCSDDKFKVTTLNK